MSRTWADLGDRIGDRVAGRSLGNGALLAAAVLGMTVTFGAGWVLGGERAQTGTPAALASRTLATGQTQSPLAAGAAGAVVLPTDLPTAEPTLSPDPSDPNATSVGAGGLPSISKAANPPIASFDCPASTIRVSTADQLTAALAAAKPGAVITLADGTYQGRFVATRDGSAKKPIYLCGGRAAVLDGGGLNSGYTLYLDGASYWRVKGFTVQDGQKGIVLDGVTGVELEGLLVQQIGDEGVHLRQGSTHNVVRELTVQQTGLRKEKFGEGVYIGTAQSNWCEVSKCRPDHSDGNYVIGNNISATTAESVDIKEGTTGGVVSDNRFDGTGMTAADSWVDVKGNGWLIIGNRGSHAPTDGYQVHQILDGWGARNLFSANISAVDASGYGIHVTKTHDGNVVNCDNQATGAAQGLTNIPCT